MLLYLFNICSTTATARPKQSIFANIQYQTEQNKSFSK